MSNIDNVKNGVFEYEGKDYSFPFFTDIDTIKKINFVNSVVANVVTDEHYQSVIRNLIFDFQVIAMFSDALDIFIDIKDKENKDFNLYEIVEIVEGTKIADIIKSNAKEGLIDELNDAVDRDIEYKTGVHRNPLGDAATSILKTLEDKIKGIDLDSLMSAAEVFKSIPMDQMTPEGVVDAYGKSDVFKQIRAEADERNAEKTAKVISMAKEIHEAKKGEAEGDSKDKAE